jgi:predicted nucleic acid-binding protein
MKVFVDSSVYVSSYLECEEQFEDSFRFFSCLKEHDGFRLFLYRLVVFEVLNTLSNAGFSWKDLHSLVSSLLESVSSELSFDSVDIGSFLHSGEKTSLKTSDLLILTCAAEYGDVLVSWDKKLLQEGSKVMECMDPKGFLEKYSG